MLLERVAGERATGLHCCVQEEDWRNGQCYSSHWQSPGFISLLSDRQTVNEVTLSHNQRFFKELEARMLLQRCLARALNCRAVEPTSQRHLMEPQSDKPKLVPKRSTVDPRVIAGITPNPTNMGGITKKTWTIGGVLWQDTHRG